jgi:hypothetical protein
VVHINELASGLLMKAVISTEAWFQRARPIDPDAARELVVPAA